MADPYASFASEVPKAAPDPYAAFASPAAPEKPQAKADEPLAKRGILFPVGETQKGEPTLAVPEIIHAPYQAFKTAWEKLSEAPGVPLSDRPEETAKQVAGEGLTAATGALPATSFGVLGRGAPGTVGAVGSVAREALSNEIGSSSGWLASRLRYAGAEPTGAMLEQAARDMAQRPVPQQAPAWLPDRLALATERAGQAAEDLAAHQELGVRPFGPAFQQGPMAATARQITEVPVVGAPLKNALDQSYRGVAEAADTVAGQVGREGTRETVGTGIQRGLQRFGSARLEELEPGIAADAGVMPYGASQRVDLMSAAARQRAADAAAIERQVGQPQARTSRGASVPPAGTRNQTLIERRDIEDLSPAELNSLIRTPADQTSFATRASALYEAADRMIPDLTRVNGSVNPGQLAAANMRQALTSINANIANQISGQAAIGGELAARFLNANSHFSLDQLRAVRTEIGRQIADYNPLQATLSGGQLRQLYGAISTDIEVGLRDLYNRALIASRLPAGDPRRVGADVVERAAGALRTFRTADRYFRQGRERIDRFMGVLNADRPEAAVDRLMAAATQRGSANMRMVRAAFHALRPEERADLTALMLRRMGTPAGSAGGITREVGFSPTSFMTAWNNMAPEARNMLFGGEHARAIDSLYRVSRRLAEVEKLANHSRTASNGLTIMGLVSGAGSIITSLMTGNPLPLATSAGVGSLMMSLSTVLSRPSYVRLAVAYANARARVLSAPFVASGRMGAMMRGNAPGAGELRALSASVREIFAAAAQDPRLLPFARQVASENGIDPSQAKEQQDRQKPLGPQDRKSSQQPTSRPGLTAPPH